MTRARSAKAVAPRPQRGALPLRVRLAMLLLAAAALVPAASLTVQLAEAGWPGGDDSLGAFDRRLTPLRERLRGEALVGYLPPGGSLEAPGSAAHFYLTRYGLAPVIVVNQLDRPLVIGDGADPRRLPAGLTVAEDLGGGLLLLRRDAP